MLYILALVLPPLAVLLTGKPIQALLNFALCFLLIVPGVIHALFVVHGFYADKRTDRLVKAIQQSNPIAEDVFNRSGEKIAYERYGQIFLGLLFFLGLFWLSKRSYERTVAEIKAKEARPISTVSIPVPASSSATNGKR